MNQKIYKSLSIANIFAIFVSVWGIGLAPRDIINFTNPQEQIQGPDTYQTRNTPETEQDLSNAALAANIPTNIYLPLVIQAPDNHPWSTVGANPERTSWTPEEVRGNLKPQWYKPFEPYILPRVQIIAAYHRLYISTARGLYALDAETGQQEWVYPTELPLGHSPTIYNQVAYVGGFDRKLHAIDAITGQGLWTFEAGAGFDTNPLVVEGKVFLGNRDGTFYSIYAEGPNKGNLAWQFQTDGPIHFSAAYKDGVIYFASDDSYAYALDSQSGSLVWKSDKLIGAGFHSWWPVIYRDYVIFAGSNNFRIGSDLGDGDLFSLDEQGVYPNRKTDPKGTLVGPIGTHPGDWVAGTTTIDASKSTVTSNGSTTPITSYLEDYPWHRTYFVLSLANGQEYTTDFDNDGNPEYAPILWAGTHGTGNRYPPIVAADDVLYQTNDYMSDPSIPGGQVSGWQIGTPYLSVISSDWSAVDEPHAYSAGGNLIYWNLCCDRQAGSYDISIPNTTFADRYLAGIRPPTGGSNSGREYSYFNYNLDSIIPGYNVRYFGGPNDVYASFGGQNGIYGYHGDQNPPIPYDGRVYLHRSNAIIAFGPQNVNPASLPMAQTVSVQDNIPALSTNQLQAELETEIQKILAVGHLRPGYINSGIFDLRAKFICGDGLSDYGHYPGDFIYTLIRALPYLSTSVRQQTISFIQSEYNAYPPYELNHIGWMDGANKDVFDLPPETEAAMASLPPLTSNKLFSGWDFTPFSFYTLWVYAQEFGGAQAIFDASQNNLEPAPANSVLLEMPYVHNAFIAGYMGYLGLEEMAGYPVSMDIQAELNRLLDLRVSSYSKDAPDEYFNNFQKYYCRSLNASRNFMFLVPELADYLHDHALADVQDTVSYYEEIAPYWFVTKSETAFGEGIITPLYDYNAIFHAKAWILQEPYGEITKYIDIPGTKVGDLLFIQNLITAIEVGS